MICHDKSNFGVPELSNTVTVPKNLQQFLGCKSKIFLRDLSLNLSIITVSDSVRQKNGTDPGGSGSLSNSFA
jgi:hypothetical protein